MYKAYKENMEIPKRAKDFTGMKIGPVQITRAIGNTLHACGRSAHILWEGICDCGATAEIPSNDLQKNIKNGRNGCSMVCPYYLQWRVSIQGARVGQRQMRNHTGAGHKGRSKLYQQYRNAAEKRGYVFELSFNKFVELISNNCHYCGIEPQMRKYAPANREAEHYKPMGGVDRATNSIGYTEENCVSCCKDCNFMKGSLDASDFLAKLKAILIYQSRE